jgi:tetratricopeptide (TPR) repeat protein
LFSNPDQLRTALFEAASSHNQKRLISLCHKNRGDILKHFRAWSVLPPTLDETKHSLNLYGNCLVTVAQAFQLAFGDSSLIISLIGDEASNPLSRWQKELSKAQAFMDSGDFQSATGILESALIDGSTLQGHGSDVMLAYSWGSLGFCYFKIGKLPEALIQTERALEFCRTTNDSQGVRVYLKNLCQIFTGLGRSSDAERCAQELLKVT